MPVPADQETLPHVKKDSGSKTLPSPCLCVPTLPSGLIRSTMVFETIALSEDLETELHKIVSLSNRSTVFLSIARQVQRIRGGFEPHYDEAGYQQNAMLNSDSMRRFMLGRAKTLAGVALISEYGEVFARADLMEKCPLSPKEQRTLLDAFLSVCERLKV